MIALTRRCLSFGRVCSNEGVAVYPGAERRAEGMLCDQA
jgi:hypothetical protein